MAVYLSKCTMESVQNFSHASCLLSSKLTSTPDVQTKNISTFHPTGQNPFTSGLPLYMIYSCIVYPLSKGPCFYVHQNSQPPSVKPQILANSVLPGSCGVLRGLFRRVLCPSTKWLKSECRGPSVPPRTETTTDKNLFETELKSTTSAALWLN